MRVFQVGSRVPAHDEPRSTLRTLGAGAALIATGVVLQLGAAARPETVERLYSRSLFRVVQSALGCLSARVSFSVGELLLLAGAVLALVLATRILTRPVSILQRFLSLLGGAVLVAGIAYCA
ncbi:MAG TPA: hypothetical protein VIG29_13815, partial [Vicinamibacteria bacterium]